MGEPDESRVVFRVGTSGWTYPHWRGLFYPQELPQSRWLEHYAAHFPAVEVNATFYRTFKDETYQKWCQRVPAGFGYVLKVPRLITHRKYLEDVKEDIERFDRSARLLGEKLELVLLQLAPDMPFDLLRLRLALSAFADPGKVAVEFRGVQWLQDDAYRLLAELGVTHCSPDSPRQVLSDRLTSEKGYLRLHGRKRWYSYDYSDGELGEIAAMARELHRRGAKRVYIFFNNDFEGFAPKNALRLSELLMESV